jgi:GntR family transcriptional regulator
MIHNNPNSQRLHERLWSVIANTPPGERLPSEPELARQLGVSRATLREAMRTFETQGLLHRRQGAGTYVLHPSQVIESGLEVLDSIETMAERIGLQVAMGEFRSQRRAPTPEESQALSVPADFTVLSLSRVILAEGGPVAYLVDIVPEDILALDELPADFSGSVLDLLIRRGAPDLLSSRCEINAVPASVEVARALGIQRGAVLLRFEAYLYAAGGRVVDYSFSYFLPGYFHFHVVRRVGY